MRDDYAEIENKNNQQHISIFAHFILDVRYTGSSKFNWRDHASIVWQSLGRQFRYSLWSAIC